MPKKKFLTLFLIFIIASLSASAHYIALDGSRTQIFFDSEPPIAGEEIRVSVVAVNDSRKPITDIDTMHISIFGPNNDEMKISPDDFSFGFEDKQQGIYRMNIKFNTGGDYSVVVNYTSKGTNYSSTLHVKVMDNPNHPSAQANNQDPATMQKSILSGKILRYVVAFSALATVGFFIYDKRYRKK
jgi:hypothetical protein